MIHFILNNKPISTNMPAGMVMVDFIRYHNHLMGTKIGCREGDCGACTILAGELKGDDLSYSTLTSCLMPLANAEGKHIVTIEGINRKELNAVQQAMCDEGATQCGFCTPGIVMSLAGFCLKRTSITGKELNVPGKNKEIVAAVDGNICRCTGYKSIERAAFRIGAIVEDMNGEEPLTFLTRKAILPDYFLGVKEKLQQLKEPSLLNGETAVAKNIDAHSFHHKSVFMGGGTDLYVQQPEAMLQRPSAFMFDRPDLKGITQQDNRCYLGASVTVSEMLASPVFREYFPDISRYMKLVSSTPIRNMATIAGNIINASPIGDLSIFFLALNAQLILEDDDSTRQLPLQDLYTGYKTLAKNAGEYIKQVWFELPGKNTLFNFEKVSKRTHLDIASVNTAISISLEDNVISLARLSAGGVSAIPLYLAGTSGFLKGKKISASTVLQAIEKAGSEIAPISDVRGTATYKRLLLKQLMKAHFITLFPDFETAALLYA